MKVFKPAPDCRQASCRQACSDFLIVGGGIAGLTAALSASKYGKVILLTKGATKETATEKAQGGIAAAIDKEKDSTKYHFEDTIAAGAGLCDKKAVKVLVKDGVDRVNELIKMGADFDRSKTGFELNIEGAHGKRRILHAGDYTGQEIARTLAAKVIKNKNIEIKNFIFGKDLIIKNKKCIGIYAFDIKSKKILTFLSPATIIATGGICQIYLYTTNPDFATGDGIAMAYRAGANVRDMEFVQFHPTALVQFKKLGEEVAFPQFLISEAVRGEGAVLINRFGKRFMDQYDAKAELAPRDIVARAIVDEMRKTNSKNVYLNFSNIDPEKIKKRFPTIYKTCKKAGLDLTKDNIPVAPAAHYFMGGIVTDLNGATNIPGLWSAGEAASSGVHGANRLASNSLLEGVVFGRRAAISASGYVKKNKDFLNNAKNIQFINAKNKSNISASSIKKYKLAIKKIMWEKVGIIRSKNKLINAIAELEKIERKFNVESINKDINEIRNMALIAKLAANAANDRRESRGAHFRTDYLDRDDKHWKRHLIYRFGG